VRGARSIRPRSARVHHHHASRCIHLSVFRPHRVHRRRALARTRCAPRCDCAARLAASHATASMRLTRRSTLLFSHHIRRLFRCHRSSMVWTARPTAANDSTEPGRQTAHQRPGRNRAALELFGSSCSTASLASRCSEPLISTVCSLGPQRDEQIAGPGPKRGHSCRPPPPHLLLYGAWPAAIASSLHCCPLALPRSSRGGLQPSLLSSLRCEDVG